MKCRQKHKVDINRPFQSGLAVFMAKLRVLQFYNNCLEKFLGRRDFELIQMDIDSLYFKLSCDSLEQAVHPEMRDEFQTCKKHCSLGTTRASTNIGCSSWGSRAFA